MSASDTPKCGSPAEVLSIFTAITGPSTMAPPVSGSVTGAGGAGGGSGVGVGVGGGVGLGLAELGTGLADELLVGRPTTASPPDEQPAISSNGTAMTPIACRRRFTFPPGAL